MCCVTKIHKKDGHYFAAAFRWPSGEKCGVAKCPWGLFVFWCLFLWVSWKTTSWLLVIYLLYRWCSCRRWKSCQIFPTMVLCFDFWWFQVFSLVLVVRMVAWSLVIKVWVVVTSYCSLSMTPNPSPVVLKQSCVLFPDEWFALPSTIKHGSDHRIAGEKPWKNPRWRNKRSQISGTWKPLKSF